MIELRRFRYFLAVSGERNFTRAATYVRIAQTPLSYAILQLEDDMCAPHLDRDLPRLVNWCANRHYKSLAVWMT